MINTEHSGQHPISAAEAQHLLNSVPDRPRRAFGIGDHVSAAATIALSFAAGLLAVGGFPWWALTPALAAILSSHWWLNNRVTRPNEPRLKGRVVLTVFTVWVLIPVWRGIMYGDTVPFPEAILAASFAPVAWLIFYIVLLIRR